MEEDVSAKRLLACASIVALLVCGRASAQAAHLVRDLDRELGDEFDGDSSPRDLTPFGTKLAFVAGERSSGDEVWVADPATGRATAQGPVCAYPCVIGPVIVGTSKTRLFFLEQSNAEGWELWASDGQPSGAQRLAAGVSNASVSAPAVTLLGEQAFFVAVRRDGALHLWTSDGTLAGTHAITMLSGAGFDCVGVWPLGARIVLALQARDGGSTQLWTSDGTSAGSAVVATAQQASLWTPTANRIYFRASTSHGAQLWLTNGTAAGTRAFTAFSSADAFRPTYWLKPAGERVYFVANDGTHGPQLWRSDTTPKGTRPITSLPAGTGGQAQHPARADEVEQIGAAVVFFTHPSLDATELWSASDTASARRLFGVCSAGCHTFSSTFIPAFARLGARLYFVAGEPAGGQEIWTTDSTIPGTHAVTSFCAVSCARIPDVQTAGVRLYFVVAPATGNQQLWSSDGSSAGTAAVTAFHSPDAFEIIGANTLFEPRVSLFQDRIWFPANEQPWGWELWSSAGTPGSTVLFADIARRAGSSDPEGWSSLGSRVVFSACDGTRRQVWSTDGTPDGTRQLTHLESRCDNGITTTAIGSFAYFWDTFESSFAFTLWRTDGTAEGTAPLVTLPELSNYLAVPFPIAGGLGFFERDVDFNVNFWVSDGSVAGTHVRSTLPAEAGSPESLIVDGPSVYFVDSGLGDNPQLWRLDAASGNSQQLTNLSENRLRPSAPNFIKLDNRIYFMAEGDPLPDSRGTFTIWSTDGTPGGTGLAIDHGSVFGGVLAVNAGSLYYFTLGAAVGSKHTLWRSDGSAAGSRALGLFDDVFAGPISAGALVFFVAVDQEHGAELWATDGTPSGTRLVRDIDPGPHGARPTDLLTAGNRVYFTADDGKHGRELWQSDGTTVGTRLVQDIAPEIPSSSPTELALTSLGVSFGANDGISGREPWLLPFSGPPCVASSTALCLGNGRYRAEATWRDFAGNTGIGMATPLTSDTGSFWFFSPTNLEVILKVLDGTGLNGHQWVFFGALSNVEYTLTVTDTQTGAVRRYFNPAGRLASVGDTVAFGPQGATAANTAPVLAAATAPAVRDVSARIPEKDGCIPSSLRLCLGGRFAVEVAWKDFSGHSGTGSPTPLSADTGDFWFFSPANIELMVKVLDGRQVNGHFWVFFGALTNVEYTVTVTDTVSGEVRVYRNASGQLASVADTAAF